MDGGCRGNVHPRGTICATQVRACSVAALFESAPADKVVFHAAIGLNATAIARVQELVRQRLLRLFVRRGLLPDDAAQAMAQWTHSGGFSVDASVRIACERLIR